MLKEANLPKTKSKNVVTFLKVRIVANKKLSEDDLYSIKEYATDTIAHSINDAVCGGVSITRMKEKPRGK